MHPLLRLDFLGPLERAAARLADRPARACVLIFLLSLFLYGVATAVTRVPVPVSHDEFSYLLGADTFAHGRISNPTPAAWKSFETFYVLVQPTYQSKYPPGQALVMAVGQVATGLPIAGVWLSGAIAASAVCWMLMGWAPRPYAVVGGVMIALHPMMLKWSQCYFGGALAVAGGALVFGALARLAAHARPRDAVLGALGIGLLLVTRPYEGGLLVLFAASVLLRRLDVRALAASRRLAPLTWALVLPLILIVALMGLYDRAITGSAARLPYAVYEQRYGAVPVLLVQPLRPVPHYDNVPMRAMVVTSNIPNYLVERRWPDGVLINGALKLFFLLKYVLLEFDINGYGFYRDGPGPSPLAAALSWFLAVTLLALPTALRESAGVRTACWGLAVSTVSLLIETWVSPHYAAPAACLAAVVILSCLAVLRGWAPDGRPIGLALSRAVIVLYAASFLVCAAELIRTPVPPWAAARASIASRLARTPGEHLVLVRYSSAHKWGEEWVYNLADIDRQKVVWARDLDPDQNRRLLAHYDHRTIWLCDADAQPPAIRPYAAAAAAR